MHVRGSRGSNSWEQYACWPGDALPPLVIPEHNCFVNDRDSQEDAVTLLSCCDARPLTGHG